MSTTLEFRSNKGIVSKLLTVLDVSDQMWLPFDCVKQANLHEYAYRQGIKVQTRTTVKGGIKGIRIKRVA
jgi:hypothetical protein